MKYKVELGIDTALLIKVFSGKLALFLCRLYVHLSTRFIYMSIVYTLLSQKSYNLRLLS